MIPFRTGVFLLFLSCASYGQPTDPHPWQRDLQSLLDAQVVAWNNGDLMSYMDGYWKSDSLLFTSGGNIRRGWQTTLDAYRKNYPTKEAMGKLLFSDLEFHLLSPESAWILGRWELSRNGERPHGLFTLVARRLPSGWKIIHDHTSVSPSEKEKQ